MALTFPPSPTVGDRYPANPGTTGVTQYVCVSLTPNVWEVVPSFVRTNNQSAYNSYKWPTTDGALNRQLTTDGAGQLSWELPGFPSATIQVLSLLEPFDGTSNAFTLVKSGTTTSYTPSPSTNIVVFLGGVAQIPTAAYTVAGNTITFTQAPIASTTFYAFSTEIV